MSDDLTPEQVLAALDSARAMAAAGVPVFVVYPDPKGKTESGRQTGYSLPTGWENHTANPAYVKVWEPGLGLCAVMGRGLDLVDFDPRHGADEASLNGAMPTVYAAAATPSGGWHKYVKSMGVRSRDNVAPGIDVKAGDPDGQGRGFAFIAPTVRASKVTGELVPYRWSTAPDLDRLKAAADDHSGARLAEMVRAAHGSHKPAGGQQESVWDLFSTGPWADVAGTLKAGRHHGVVRLASALRGRGGWRVGDAIAFMQVKVWPLIDQNQGGHPYPETEFVSDITDVFNRYDDGPSTPIAAGNELAGQEAPELDAAGNGDVARFEFVAGGSFILDTSPDPEPLWGSGDDVLLADGESLIIAARGGLGKTTLAQQLALGRCGFSEYAELLGYPIKPGRRVLYLAMDRPRQIARSFRRMVGEAWRDELDRKLLVWQGPPPADLAKHPGYLLALCVAADADTVFVDSLKDAAIGLSDDDVGAGYNRARQKAITAGVQVVELHHNRKELSGSRDVKLTIDDLYGSTWLPSGAGSVFILTGAAGDPIVGLHHVKQPVSEVGPLQIIHDQEHGRTSVWHAADLVMLAAANVNGVTAKDAAAALYTTETPQPAQVEKARRRLDKLARSGQLRCIDGNRATATPARYLPSLGVA